MSNEHHEYASLFPMLPDDDLQALADDIRKHGLRQSIVIDQDEKILDGRNRSAACTIAGVAPTFEPFVGTDAEKLQFVVSCNIHRRHLDTSQRAMLGARLEDEFAKLAKERQKAAGKTKGRGQEKVVAKSPPPKSKARDQAAKVVNVGGRSISDAKTVLTKGTPEQVKAVEAGKSKVSTVANEIRKKEKAAELDKKAEQAKQKHHESDRPQWTLINMDVMDGLEQVNTELGPARLIFADPPYNIGIDYGEGPDADRIPYDVFTSWCAEWIHAATECLTDDGSLWLLVPDEMVAECAMAAKRYGMTIRSWIKWYETFGVNCRTKFNRTSRHILYCVQDDSNFVWNPEAVTRPSDRQTKYNDKRANASGKIWDDVWQIPRLTGTCEERVPGVPTQIPLALIKPIIECASDPGDLVVDPFNGSGTTGVAAIQAGRKYIGIDRSSEFIDIAKKRLVLS